MRSDKIQVFRFGGLGGEIEEIIPSAAAVKNDEDTLPIPKLDPTFSTFAGRSTNIDTVYAELARIFETRTTAEWIDLLTEADIPVMPMHDLESILRDPHLASTGFFPIVDHPSEGKIRSMKTSARWSETPSEPSRLAPRLNEHGGEILKEAGFSEDQIATLVREGATLAAPDSVTG